MTKLPTQKLLIGPRIRRLRQSLGLTQAVMADALGISTSYMNLIERNQRPVSAKLLLRLVDVYDFDLSNLSPDSEVRLFKDVQAALKSPLFRGLSLSGAELRDVISASPDFARAFLTLQAQAETLQAQAALRPDPLADRDKVELLEEGAGAVESVRRFIHEQHNYFDPLDRAAEELSQEMGLETRQPHTALTDRLRERHGIKVRIVPADLLPHTLALYDPHRKRLSLSELLPQSGRRFRLAYQLALLEQRPLIDAVIARALLPSKEADALARVSLANYFAAAVLMPYERFLREAERCAYDVELLTRRFDTSYEQTAHRLTTLQRKGRRGVPFFFVRVDQAGNISKRFSAGQFHFSRFGGACPLWNIHACFRTPGETTWQIIEMEDGTKYFSIARAVLRPEGAHGEQARMVAIGLGCELKHAHRLVYAQNRLEETPTLIGVNCYICERENCRSRAHAPISRRLRFDERARRQSIFSFDR
ncbi:MAG TPA: XRE family transcriptional regulator [Hellea balneolensis]|uniref:XRE family transcriptional regulator n=1 Tax=Hellea balneolensis TaxID=287478 RepID=A0A7V5NY24_9PROT|nr:XRE family transcriptional regulator [Hellea balneolensis]